MIDIELIERAIENDGYAFRIIFDKYKTKVYKTACLILKDGQYAEDVVQEAFLQVQLKLKKLSNPWAFERWLYKITINLCYEQIRKKGKKETTCIDEILEQQEDVMISDSYSLEETVIQNELYRSINDKVNILSDKHRMVLVLFYFNELSVTEIAEILSTTEGTVKSRLFYARKLLKETLEKSKSDSPGYEGGVLYENR